MKKISKKQIIQTALDRSWMRLGVACNNPPVTVRDELDLIEELRLVIKGVRFAQALLKDLKRGELLYETKNTKTKAKK